MPVLLLCLVVILAGHTSVTAITQFGCLRRHRLGHELGFRNGKMPYAKRIAHLPRDLDADHLDRLFGTWRTSRHAAGCDPVALDGKTLRGSRYGDVPGTHLLAAYAPQVPAVLAQLRVETTNTTRRSS